MDDIKNRQRIIVKYFEPVTSLPIQLEQPYRREMCEKTVNK